MSPCASLVLPLLYRRCVSATQQQLPADHSVLSEDVTKMGLRSALKSCTRRAIGFLKQEKKPKKKRKLQIQHMTNTHLAHVLNDNQYTSID